MAVAFSIEKYPIFYFLFENVNKIPSVWSAENVKGWGDEIESESNAFQLYKVSRCEEIF